MRTVTTGSTRTPRRRTPAEPVSPRSGRRQQLLQGCFTSLGVALVVALSSTAPPPDLSLEPSGRTVAAVPDDRARLWSASWSERFPGCVAVVLWPEGERPVALVTRSPDGAMNRLEVGAAQRVPLGDRVVGACR
jgi:hypothetical protein